MRNKVLKVLLLVFLFAILPISLNRAEARSVKRIQGENRYSTSVEISKEAFEKSDTAILAFGGNYVDALVGGTLATQLKIPILLTETKSLPAVVKSELERLAVKKVYILGGDAVISSELETELKRNYDVERLSGKNRYETARAINYKRQTYATGKADFGDWRMYSIVANNNFPDALAAAPFVGQLTVHDQVVDPINLSGGFLMMPYWKGVMDYGFYFFGGTNAIPFQQVEDYGAYFGTRIEGANRYGTAVEIAKLYPGRLNKSIDTVVLADGTNYPDALSAAPYVGGQNAVLLLTQKDSLPKETRFYIQQNNIQNIIVLGGENAVSSQVIEEIIAIK